MGSDDSTEANPLLSSRVTGMAPLEVKVMRGSGHEQRTDAGLQGMRALSEVFPAWFGLCRLWFQSEDKWRARRYATANVVLALATTLFMVRISYAQSSFQTAMSGKDEGGFYKAIWVFVGVICVAVPLFAAADWTEDRLCLEWRNYLTQRLLKTYFSNRAFFNLKLQLESVDNPDQRICDDVASFVELSVFMVMTFVKQLFNCIAFAGVLWTVAPKLVFILIAYAVLGTWLTTSVFGRPMMALYFGLLKSEGDLRFDLVRVRENAESIAFYRGEHREAEIAGGRLRKLVKISRAKIRLKMLLALWQNAYGYATILVPSLLTAPRYFRGEIEFGVISQVGFAFSRIEHALSMLITNLSELSGLAAKTERIDALFKALALRPAVNAPRIVRVPSTESGIELQALTLFTPESGTRLSVRLDLRVKGGESLLIVGPSGCGKSSLLRAIAGLWGAGSGRIHTPMASSMFFLPQKPFMPLGTLRQQLVFPAGDTSASERTAGAVGAGAASDSELLALLDEVHLPGLVEQVGGLDAELDWAHTLSLGEQQRIAFLRLLLHRPAVAFLDEATGALDETAEAALYLRLMRTCDCVISVGHRMLLVQYHTHVLAAEKGGVWTKYTSEEYTKQLQSR